jgi:hypothetical protein
MASGLEGVSVHLFLEKSGSLSRDVTAVKDFQSWNFVPSGTGIPDDERFNDILVKVRSCSLSMRPLSVCKA